MSIKIRPSTLTTVTDCYKLGASKILYEEFQEFGAELNVLKQGIGSLIGNSGHASSAYMHETRHKEGELPSVNNAIDFAINDLSNISKVDIQYDNSTKNLNTAEWQLRAVVGAYYSNVALDTIPLIHNGELMVEKRFEVGLGDGFILSFCPDLISDGLILQDQKSGINAKYSGPQYGGYAFGLHISGITIKGIQEDHTPRPKKINEACDYRAIPYEVNTSVKSAMSIIKDVKEKSIIFMKKQDPYIFPANPNSNLCSRKYCPLFKTDLCKESMCK